MEKEENVRLNIRIPKSMKDKLEELAQIRHLTKSDIARAALYEYLREDETVSKSNILIKTVPQRVMVNDNGGQNCNALDDIVSLPHVMSVPSTSTDTDLLDSEIDFSDSKLYDSKREDKYEEFKSKPFKDMRDRSSKTGKAILDNVDSICDSWEELIEIYPSIEPYEKYFAGKLDL